MSGGQGAEGVGSTWVQGYPMNASLPGSTEASPLLGAVIQGGSPEMEGEER